MGTRCAEPTRARNRAQTSGVVGLPLRIRNARGVAIPPGHRAQLQYATAVGAASGLTPSPTRVLRLTPDAQRPPSTAGVVAWCAEGEYCLVLYRQIGCQPLVQGTTYRGILEDCTLPLLGAEYLDELPAASPSSLSMGSKARRRRALTSPFTVSSPPTNNGPRQLTGAVVGHRNIRLLYRHIGSRPLALFRKNLEKGNEQDIAPCCPPPA
jgi:hypothetical protein